MASIVLTVTYLAFTIAYGIFQYSESHPLFLTSDDTINGRPMILNLDDQTDYLQSESAWLKSLPGPETMAKMKTSSTLKKPQMKSVQLR